MQFDYVTGVLFFWVVLTSTVICICLWTLAEVLRHRDKKFNDAKFKELSLRMSKFDTRLKGIEKLWLDIERSKIDSKKKGKVK